MIVEKQKSIAVWLYVSAASVFLMALIGAITRLTESGLSIAEWKPITGALPPLNAADWQATFDIYKQTPQYLKINHGMSLEEFKNIFFWEWLHRLWGRLIGVVYAVPLLFFWRYLPKPTRPLFIGVLALGFMQGAMGWYMVQSGLVDEPAVSHYRLAAHLMLAFLIYGCLLRLGMMFSHPPVAGVAASAQKIRPMIRATLWVAILTMTWGAFVAGKDGGLVYNTFPTMNGHWIPPELFAYASFTKAFFEDPAVLQFTHRVLAILLFIKSMVLIRRAGALAPKGSRLFLATVGFGLSIVLQLSLGIATLLTQVQIILATLHQGGALVVLSMLIWMLHETSVKKEKETQV